MEPKTLQEAVLYFASPDNCREYMVVRRWPNGVECPRCNSKNVLFLQKYNRWHCREKHEAPQFTLKTGTVMEDSPIGLDKWLIAMWLVVNCKNGVSSWEIHRSLKITQKSAWFMLHRIRTALGVEPEGMMGGDDGGPVEVDETFVGPDPRKMHKNKREERFATLGKRPKTPVMGLLDRDSRELRAKVVPNVKRETLQNTILENIEKGSKVYTDQGGGYTSLAAQEYIHETVNHLEEYVRGEVHTQGLENFWALLKRGLKGTYIAVEPYHLDKYVGEQCFRYNNRSTRNRPVTDGDRLSIAVSQIINKRLTYKELTGKEDARPF